MGRLACDPDYSVPGTRRFMGPINCKPVETIVAALHDLETGRRIWSVRATVHRPSPVPTPAISDDERYALVGLPSDQARLLVALISMNDGRIVQTLPVPRDNLDSMGFAHGGRTVWIHANGLTAFYNVRADGQ